MKIVSIQQRTIVIGNGSSSNTANITAVGDLTRSVCWGSWKVGTWNSVNINSQDVFVDIFLSNSTTITAERIGTGQTLTVEVFVIEFDSSVTVQKGTFNLTGATSSDTTISAVNLSNAFSKVYYKMASDVGTYDWRGNTSYVLSELTSTTNLKHTRVSSIGAGDITGHWWVVEDSGLDVTHETVNVVSGNVTHTLAASRSVVLANTILSASQESNNNNYNDEAILNVSLLSATQLFVQDSYDSATEDTAGIYVIEDTALNVQHFSMEVSTGISGTVAITAVDLNRAIVVPIMTHSLAIGSDFNPGLNDGKFVSLKFTSATEVTWERSEAAAGTIFKFQVIEFELAPSFVLVVQDAVLEHVSDNIDLIQKHTLAVQDAALDHVVDGDLNLTQKHTLSIQDAALEHVADNVDLIQKHILSVDNADLEHAADNVDLIEHITLTVQDAVLDHTVDNIGLIQKHVLDPQDTALEHTVENVVLVQKHILSVDDVVLEHTAENVDLVESEILTVQDAALEHTSENIDLIQKHILTVDNAVFEHTADNVVLSTGSVLDVDDAFLEHAADNVDLVQKHILDPQDTIFDHVAENVVLVQKHTLTVDDVVIDHTAENVDLSVKYVLSVQDAVFEHTADNVVLGFPLDYEIIYNISPIVVERIRNSKIITDLISNSEVTIQVINESKYK